MINEMKVLAYIPARGGSKGVKDKNIKRLNGIPLVGHTISAAKMSRYVDYVFVSTDNETIKNVSLELGAEVPFLRDAKYAQDTSRTIDAIIDDVKRMKNNNMLFDILVLLQPTSPLRTVQNIDEAIEKFVKSDCKGLVSVSPVCDHPIFIRSIDENGEMHRLLNTISTIRRQDMPSYYRVNGAIYINSIEELNEDTSLGDNIIPYIMDEKNSVDIDTIDDFEYAEFLMKRGN